MPRPDVWHAGPMRIPGLMLVDPASGEESTRFRGARTRVFRVETRKRPLRPHSSSAFPSARIAAGREALRRTVTGRSPQQTCSSVPHNAFRRGDANGPGDAEFAMGIPGNGMRSLPTCHILHLSQRSCGPGRNGRRCRRTVHGRRPSGYSRSRSFAIVVALVARTGIKEIGIFVPPTSNGCASSRESAGGLRVAGQLTARIGITVPQSARSGHLRKGAHE